MFSLYNKKHSKFIILINKKTIILFKCKVNKICSRWWVAQMETLRWTTCQVAWWTSSRCSLTWCSKGNPINNSSNKWIWWADPWEITRITWCKATRIRGNLTKVLINKTNSIIWWEEWAVDKIRVEECLRWHKQWRTQSTRNTKLSYAGISHSMVTAH